MQMKLNRLDLIHFKGVKAFAFVPGGENARIVGENGTGKTTVYDAFLWLLFGKDSTGRTDFACRPLDGDNQPIKGLTVAVQAQIEVDGTEHVLRKEHTEKSVKGQFRGYESAYWIDDVPKKAGEFAEYVGSLIDEDTFRLLTDLRHFNAGLHWTDRRRILLDLAGEIAPPPGFDDLLAQLKRRTLDEFRKVLAEQKKGYAKERDEINPRIDELQRTLNEMSLLDDDGLASERERMRGEIEALDKKRAEAFASEKQRQATLGVINELDRMRAKVEAELRADTSGIAGHLTEKRGLQEKLDASAEKVRKAEIDVHRAEAQVEAEKAKLHGQTAQRDQIRQHYAAAKNTTLDETCSACGQTLPADRLAEIRAKHKERLASIVSQGNTIQAAIKATEAKLADLQKAHAAFAGVAERVRTDYGRLEQSIAAKLAEIDKRIESREAPDPAKDKTWCDLTRQIETQQKKVGPSVADQLEEVEKQRTALQEQLASVNAALANIDRAKADRARIAELADREKELSQKIADVDAMIDQIGQYKAAESQRITDAVNGKFEHVTFRLFKECLNGSIEDTCDALLDGVPYPDMSCGQKILVGVDIINTLSAWYDASIPLFVDNAESLTLPLEAKGQTIQLVADPKARTLKVASASGTKEKRQKQTA